MANNRFIGRLNAFNQYMAYRYGSDMYWFNFDKRDYCVSQELGMEFIQRICDRNQKGGKNKQC